MKQNSLENQKKKRHYEQRILETVHNFFSFTEIIEAISSQLDWPNTERLCIFSFVNFLKVFNIECIL